MLKIRNSATLGLVLVVRYKTMSSCISRGRARDLRRRMEGCPRLGALYVSVPPTKLIENFWSCATATAAAMSAESLSSLRRCVALNHRDITSKSIVL